MKKLLAGLLGAVSLVAVPASAAIVTTTVQVLNFGPAQTEFSSTTNGVTTAGITKTFALFDSSLGQLLSVNLADGFQENSTLSVTNTNTAGGNAVGKVGSISQLYFTAANSGQNAGIQAALQDQNAGDGSMLTATGPLKNFSVAANSTQNNIVSNSALVTSSATISAADTSLAQYLGYFAAVGGGIASLTASTVTNTNLVYQGGNLQTSQNTTGQGSFSISYTYDDAAATPAVPEPGTWLMMIAGFGLVGVGLRRRGTALSLS